MAHAKDGSNTKKVRKVVNKRLIFITLYHYAKKYSIFIGQPLSTLYGLTSKSADFI